HLLHGCLLLFAGVAALIPREKLVADSNSAEKLALSPDGKSMGFISADENQNRNVFTFRISDRRKRQVTFEQRDVLDFSWTGVQDIITFSEDTDGEENLMFFKKNISESATQHERTIISNTPGVQAQLVDNNKRDRFILIGINDDTPSRVHVYNFDLVTNELSRVFTNTRFAVDSIGTDNDMRIRLAYEQQEYGTRKYFRKELLPQRKFSSNMVEELVDLLDLQYELFFLTSFLGFDKRNKNVYWIWGEDTGKGELIVAPFSDFSKRKVSIDRA
ncbi:hypothetical protein PENTCL1PPCAC_29796, partial [Pristionchus entomophagus]